MGASSAHKRAPCSFFTASLPSPPPNPYATRIDFGFGQARLIPFPVPDITRVLVLVFKLPPCPSLPPFHGCVHQNNSADTFTKKFSNFDPLLYLIVVGLLLGEVVLVIMPIVVKVSLRL